MKRIQELIEYLAKHLVENQDDVSVSDGDEQDGELVFELRVAESDRGKVIGKRGRTAHAIRTILNASSEENVPVVLQIVD